MKKVIALFFITYIFSYANYLITNSEIVLFYDVNEKRIENIKGDVFDTTGISKLEPKIVIDGKDVIPLEKYLKKADFIEGANVFRMLYEIEERKDYRGEIEIDVIPSMYEKNRLEFLVKFRNFEDVYKAKNIDFVFKLAPQKSNRYVDFNIDKNSYSYDNFYLKVQNKQGLLYIGKDGEKESLNITKVLIEGGQKSKKYEEESLYYVIKDIDFKEDINLSIRFYRDFKDTKVISPDEILTREISYWRDENRNNQDKIFLKNLENIKLLGSRILIPSRIGDEKSIQDIPTKMKFYYLASKYDKDFEVLKFFEDMNKRRNEYDALVFYTMLFRYLNENGYHIEGNIKDRKIVPEVLALLDYLEEVEDEVINVRDNIDNYFWYFELIKNIENRESFKSEQDFIRQKKRFLLAYLNQNFVARDGLKSRRESLESDYKNIGYIGFLDREKQTKILENDYKKYYDRNYGVLKERKDREIDVRYNLNFVIKLYENGKVKLGDEIFSNLKKYMEISGAYPSRYISLEGENIPEIDIETLYLYFEAENIRGRYGDKK